MKLTPRLFQHRLLKWFDLEGRKTLPWQQNKTPYRVWVSEIMLQQTQVNTVIPYFNHFMQRFPSVHALAFADENDVLHAWSGLGYYSRARNLHRTAQFVVEHYSGELPNTILALQQLPGIGPSTAGAIAAIAFNQAATILDGNVKRVLTRLHGITDPVNDKKTETTLWKLACQYTPIKRTADYTQAIMDLGATLCTRRKPACDRCPFIELCVARQHNLVDSLPAKKRSAKLPVRTATFLLVRHQDTVLLQKRPPSGIWGGLFSMPELAGMPDHQTLKTYCQQSLRLSIKDHQRLPAFRHTFSHYHLDIFPIIVNIIKKPTTLADGDNLRWYNLLNPDTVGIPKPVERMLNALKSSSNT